MPYIQPMTTIALYNLKGGVGKTAGCVNFAYLSAMDGYRTLIWDLDPQGSTTFYYQVKPKLKGGIRKLITQASDLEDAVMNTEYEGLDIIPADQSSKSLDVMIEEMKHSRKKLKHIVQAFKKEYDFIFMDCPPGLSVLAENIFVATDIILMPVIPTTLSVRTYEMVKAYMKEKELDLSKLTCFFTMVDLRKNMHNEIMEILYKDKHFFQSYIPYLSDVEKMGIYQAPVEVFARSSYAAQCYRDLWVEIKEGVL
jgi:cellulose biosynthesis protein BcsQ